MTCAFRRAAMTLCKFEQRSWQRDFSTILALSKSIKDTLDIILPIILEWNWHWNIGMLHHVSEP